MSQSSYTNVFFSLLVLMHIPSTQFLYFKRTKGTKFDVIPSPPEDFVFFSKL